MQHYNPRLKIYALFGGPATDKAAALEAMQGLAEAVWTYPGNKPKDWKWRHTDLMLKAWYRTVGRHLDFDFLYSYEYDLLTLKPLGKIYPDIDDHTLALSACEPFTKEIEYRWSWTAFEPSRTNFLKFCDYLEKHYGFRRQQKVCLGPGPLFPRAFLDQWSKTEDIELVHDEIAYPAYAEALGFKMVDHGMHPGFGLQPDEKYFNCEHHPVTLGMITEQLAKPQGRRTFHPVTARITVEDILDYAS